MTTTPPPGGTPRKRSAAKRTQRAEAPTPGRSSEGTPTTKTPLSPSCVAEIPSPTRAQDLRADYDVLGRLLTSAEGSAAAAIARERRIIGELLESLESPKKVPLVDQLADRRQSRTKSGGAADRRRKSG